VLIKLACGLCTVPLRVEVFGDWVVVCRNGRCLWLQPNRGIDYYIERIGLLNPTCEDVMEIANVLGAPQLVSAYCTLKPVFKLPETLPRRRFIINLPNPPPQELVGLVAGHCQVTVEGRSLVVIGPLTRECLSALSAFLTVLNGALSLVLDGRVVSIGRGEVCVDGDCLGIVDCDYDALRWLRRLGLGLPSALLTCGLVVLINNPTAGVGDQDVPKESDPKQGK